ncbi:MAG TPA: ribonuclease P protein component [Rudaea sp.]
MALRFPRAARLLKPGDFTALRRNARRLHGGIFQIEYRPNDAASSDAAPTAAATQPPPIARLGMAVSRRVSKKAVVRNRIRRTIRESFRLHRALLPACDVLVIARTSAAERSNAELRADLETIWQRLSALKPDGAAVKMPPGS